MSGDVVRVTGNGDPYPIYAFLSVVVLAAQNRKNMATPIAIAKFLSLVDLAIIFHKPSAREP